MNAIYYTANTKKNQTKIILIFINLTQFNLGHYKRTIKSLFCTKCAFAGFDLSNKRVDFKFLT